MFKTVKNYIFIAIELKVSKKRCKYALFALITKNMYAKHYFLYEQGVFKGKYLKNNSFDKGFDNF